MSAKPTTSDRPEAVHARGPRSPGAGALASATLGVALAALAPAGAAQPAPRGDAFDLAHPAVRSFTDREGLPQNTVHAIARDALGYLWVGTQEGAARWNGREWVIIDMPDREVSNYVRTLAATRDCTLWFGREAGGLVRLRRDPLHPTPRRESFTVFGAEQGLPAARVNGVLEASDGTIWAATSAGAARLAGDRFETLNDGLDDLRLWVIAEIEDDAGRKRIAAGGEGGLFMLEGRAWSAVDLGPRALAGSVNSLLQTREASGARMLWVGTYGRGVLRVRGGQVDRFGPREGLGSRLVTALAATRRGAGDEEIWAGTRDAGLFRLAGGRFQPVPLGATISEVYVLRAGGDDDPGALWVGTRTEGLLRLEAGSWLSLDRSSGLPADQVLGLLETQDPDGQPVYWIGTADGLAVIRGSRLSVEGAAQGLPGPQVLAIAELRERGRPAELWASIRGLGLVRRVGGRWVRVDAGPVFNADHGAWLLPSTAPDGGAVMWVGTERSGLARMQRGRWTLLTTRDGLPSDHVVSLLETQTRGTRTLWVGTRGGGLAEVVDGRVARAWNRSSGLPNDDALTLAELRVGGRRELWVGTRAGVARRDLDAVSPAWSRLAVALTPSGPAGTVLSIGEDRSGRIYLGTQRGVVRLTPLLRAEPGAEEFSNERFGVADGLPSATANWRQLRDSRGRIWIATTGGVALLDPAHEAAFQAPPAPLLFERAQATSTGLAIEHGAALPFGAHDVLFEYALLSTRRVDAVRYRTQLVGYDRDFSAWVAGSQKAYTNLPAHDYLFRVEARDAAGRRSGPIELRFSVEPSPWLRPWAIVLQALGLVGLATLLVRARERTLRRQAEELEALVAERTRQLQEANNRLSELSVTDPLTGLANRRALEAHADGEWRRIARAGGSLAVVMVDVDHFKAYNDSLGHVQGDECLRLVAAALRRLAQRPGDLVARYGGEEFACLFVGLEREQARAYAERLRATIEELGVRHPASSVAPVVTISLGVAWSRPLPSGDWRTVLAAADAALYRAKQGGRNRVELAATS
jgi:diguanylate cyclase (GGDEF)-like protein